MEVVWGDNPPASAAATLNTYISHLRAALEPGRAPRAQSGVLLTREPGYLLAVDPERVDALRFERLTGEGRRALATGDAAKAASTLREGLNLWRGGALADFVYEPFAHAEATRLEELRLATLEQRVDADLASGDTTIWSPSSGGSSRSIRSRNACGASSCSPCTAAVARARPSGPTANCARCWPRSSGSTRAPPFAGWRRTCSGSGPTSRCP